MSAGSENTIIVVGGGIGGMACALGLIQAGFDVTLLEQAPEIGEIGAGIQLGPNAFSAMDALGCGPRARARAVYTDDLIMMDAVDESVVGLIPVHEAFRERFGNPYAVIHRADIHKSIYEEVQTKANVALHTSTKIVDIDINDKRVRVTDQHGGVYEGAAVIGCDGVHSVVRKELIGDGGAHVPGHVVYRAVTPRDEFPEDLRWNAAAIWVGPKCHLVHYPLRGGEQYNIVVTFHSREKEEWGVREGSREEVMSYFTHIADRPRQLIHKPTSWRRWTIADRDPVMKWGEGRATLLGDAAHPMLQYMAQGACMALEDAVTLREALRVCDRDVEKAFRLYETKRIPRTGRVVLSAREMGRLFHADGVERLIRNSMWQGRSPERYYDAIEWLYGWSVDKCLD
jgi:3-hydroxybenzoate 6-monooxygenase